MFRSKRQAHVKRLWRQKVCDEGNCEVESDGGVPRNEASEVMELKAVSHTMLKRLKEKQLDILVDSVDSKGGETTECVLLPKEPVRIGRRTVSHQHLCCRLWRWPDLNSEEELKRLPCCKTDNNDPAYICCNPYHWSRMSKSADLRDIPPSRTVMHTPSNTGGVADGGEHWCSIAYWEQRQRVGRLYTVSEDNIQVFQVLPHGDGMCLEILQQNSNLEAVRRTREKIGFGVILSREGCGVWVYNRSLFPIFVNSPTLDVPKPRSLVVRKLLPGYSIQIFDYDEASVLENLREMQDFDGPFDPSSIRISFAKGWGPCYSRQFVTSCPCWVEILLHVNR